MHDGYRLGGLALVGAPTDAGLRVPGPALGPAALRAAGLSGALRQQGLAVTDAGDVPAPAGADRQISYGCRNLPAVLQCCSQVRDRVRDALRNAQIPVLLGGDHAASLGSLAAVADHCRARGRRLAVLWLDAHADCNTPGTSPSGNLHGMPLAIATGYGPEPLLRLAGTQPMVAPERAAIFGLRSVDQGERDFLRDRDIRVFDSASIRRLGVQQALAAALEHLGGPGTHLHVSLDLDVLEPLIAPGVSVPEPGGLLTEEACAVFAALGRQGNVGSLDVMELNPLRDRKGATARLAVELIARLFQRASVTEGRAPVRQVGPTRRCRAEARPTGRDCPGPVAPMVPAARRRT